LRTKSLGLVGSSPANPKKFQHQIAKKINMAPSVRVIIICSDKDLLWPDSDKDTDHASTLPESILHQIAISVEYFYIGFRPHYGCLYVIYISSLIFEVRKKIISALDRVIPWQDFCLSDFLIFV